MSRRAVERLAQLLEVERKALLSGDFEELNALTEEKEALASQLEGASARDIHAVSAALKRNGEMLAASLEGVSTVLATLAQQRAARESLSSYDSGGNATRISSTSGGTERRF